VPLPPTIHPLLAGLAGATSAWLTAVGLRFRGDPGTRSFVGLAAAAAVWAFGYGFALVTPDPQLRRLLEIPIWIGRVSIPVAWLVFALEYTGRTELLTRGRVAVLCVFPVATLVALFVNPAYEVLFSNYRIASTAIATVQYDPTPYFWTQLLYSYALIGTGTLILFGMVLSPERLFSVQAWALVVGATIPTITNVFWLLDRGPVPGLDLTPAALSVTCGLFAVALLRFDLLGLSPGPQRLGWRTAIEDFEEGVLVVGTDGRVVDANPAARALFPATDPFGSDVTALLGREDLPVDETLTLGLDTPVGRRRFEITVSPVEDGQGRQIGRTFVLHDITEREQREQRLSVLNRVLRHNLRNDMNVIHGCAEAASGETDRDDEYLRLVGKHADELVELSETARTIQRVVDADPSLTREIDVAAFLDDLLGEVTDGYSSVTVEMETPEQATLVANPSVVRAVLHQALENAVKHGDGRVRVECHCEEGWVAFAVADDGQGLPDLERRAIKTETETDLIHSGGLGLWLIRWGTRTLGGELSVDASEWDGTRLLVRLPADRDPDAVEAVESGDGVVSRV
jgi:signal transduction histidine kinase